MINNLIQGDCLEKLKELADNSVDSVVTDPPAGISFMGKTWDNDKGGRDHWIAWKCEIAKECLRVLKPGGHALVWALPRTAHWTTTAWENAGFEVRDILAHLFGSGFPKSHNIGKSVARLNGADIPTTKGFNVAGQGIGLNPNKELRSDHPNYKKPRYENIFEGWGTALKPAREDYILLRKPFKGTVASNVLEWGTGGINIDKSRVGNEKHTYSINGATKSGNFGNGANQPSEERNHKTAVGRWPANIIHDGSEEVLAVFPETKTNGVKTKFVGNPSDKVNIGGGNVTPYETNSGSASRFFYCAKPSKSERNAGVNLYTLNENTPKAIIVEIQKYLTGI